MKSSVSAVVRFLMSFVVVSNTTGLGQICGFFVTDTLLSASSLPFSIKFVDLSQTMSVSCRAASLAYSRTFRLKIRLSGILEWSFAIDSVIVCV